ncbi:hypothetical protein LTR29_007396 [Friedmanniomyces endolithicus]|nr:hypothetical protein LTR29_007396 [Friedmanniomyces endolithicus]
MAKSKPASRPTAASVRSSATANYRVRPSPLGQAQPRVQKSAAGAHLDVMLKAEAIKRMAPHATSSGSNSVPVAEYIDCERRAGEGPAELKRERQRLCEREAAIKAGLSDLHDTISSFDRTFTNFQEKLKANIDAGQVNGHADCQRLAQERLAHLERENLELRQRETEYQAKMSGMQDGARAILQITRTAKKELQGEIIRSTEIQTFLMNKLAEAVVWNRLQYHHNPASKRDRFIAGWGVDANLALDTQELSVTHLETWLALISEYMRDLFGEHGVTSLDALVLRLHERRYGSLPEGDAFRVASGYAVEEDEKEDEEEGDGSERKIKSMSRRRRTKRKLPLTGNTALQALQRPTWS